MSLIQHAFRFYNDDGGEATSTPFAAENANISWPLDTNIILRLGVTHDGSAAPSTSKYMLFAAPVGTEAWFEVSPTGAGKLRIAQSGGSPNNIPAGGVATTQRLSAPNVSPSPSFVAGRMWDDESGQDDVAIANGQCTEVGWCIRAVSANGAVNGAQYKFHVQRIPGSGAGQLASDNFDRANGAIGAPWAVNADAFNISGNDAVPGNKDNDALARYTGPTWTNNQYSEIIHGTTLSFGGAGVGCGVAVFLDTGGANTGYRLVGNLAGWELVRVNAGTVTSISNAADAFATGDVMRLQVNGATGAWSVWKNGVSIASGTDGSHLTSGAAGIAYSSTASTDNSVGIASWVAGSL